MPNQKTPADRKRRPAQPPNLPPSPGKTAAVKGGKKPIVLDTSTIKGESLDDVHKPTID